MKRLFDNGRHGPLSFKLWDLMAELVLQISYLSFRYECSRIKLNMLKLYVTYLGFCGVYSFLFFFFRKWISITRWWKDIGLISDTSVLWVFIYRGLPCHGVLVHSNDKFFLFSQCSLRGIILEFGCLHIPNCVIGFSTNKCNSLCVFIPWGINGN